MDLPTVDLPTVDPPGTAESTSDAESRPSWAASAESQPDWSAAASEALAASAAIAAATGADAEDQLSRRKGKRSADADKPKWPDSAQNERDEETGLLNRQGLRRRLAAARRQARPTALTLVRLEPSGEAEPDPEPRKKDPDSTDRFSAALIKAIDTAGRIPPEIDPDVLASLADHVRDMAPDDAELARPDEGELAVLMPDTTRDEAEQFAATLRETVSASDWAPQDPARGVSVSTGVAQYQEGTSEDALLSAAREALTSADHDQGQDRPDWQSVEPVYDFPPVDSGYTYMEGYTGLSSDGPDQEMAEYLAGFPLPDVGGKWPSAEDVPLPGHDAADAGDDGEEGRSVLDRLDITRGSGGRRRAQDELRRGQSADFDQYAINQPMRTYSNTGDEILAAAEEAERASIPLPPDPDEVPTPPEGPEIPVPPDPDVDPEPKPGRRRRSPVPAQPDEDPDAEPRPKPGRNFPLGPDIPTPPGPDTDPDPRRRRWTSELDPENPRARRRALPRDPTRRAVDPDDEEPETETGTEPAGRRRMPEKDDEKTPTGRRRMPEPGEEQETPAHPARTTTATTAPTPTGRRRMPEKAETPETKTPTTLHGKPNSEKDTEAKPRAAAPGESTGRRRMPETFDRDTPPGTPEIVDGRRAQDFSGRDDSAGEPETFGRRRMPESHDPAGLSGRSEPADRQRATELRARNESLGEPESAGRRRMPETFDRGTAPGALESAGGRRAQDFSDRDDSASGPEALDRGTPSGAPEFVGGRRAREPFDRNESTSEPETVGRRRMPESHDPAELSGRSEPADRQRATELPVHNESLSEPESASRRRPPETFDRDDSTGESETVGRRRMPESYDPGESPGMPEPAGRRRMPETFDRGTPPGSPESAGGRRGQGSLDRDESVGGSVSAGRRRSAEASVRTEALGESESVDGRGISESFGRDGSPRGGESAGPRRGDRDVSLDELESAGRRRMPESGESPEPSVSAGRRRVPEAPATGDPADQRSAGRRRTSNSEDESPRAARESAESAGRRRAPEAESNDPSASGRRAQPQPWPGYQDPMPSVDAEAGTVGRRRKPDSAAESGNVDFSLTPEVPAASAPDWPSDPLGLDAIFAEQDKPRDLPSAGDEGGRRRRPELPTQDDVRTADEKSDPLGHEAPLGGEAPQTERESLGLEAILGEPVNPHGEAQQPDETTPARRSGPRGGSGPRRNLSEIADGFEEAARRRTSPEATARRRTAEPGKPQPAPRGTHAETTARRRSEDSDDEFTTSGRRGESDQSRGFTDTSDSGPVARDSSDLTTHQRFADFEDSSEPTRREAQGAATDDLEPAGRRGGPGEATVRREFAAVDRADGVEDVTPRRRFEDAGEPGAKGRPGEATVRRARPGEATVFQRQSDSLDGLAGDSGRPASLRRTLDTELVGPGSAPSGAAARRGEPGGPDGGNAPPPRDSGLPPEQSGPVDLDDFPRRRPVPPVPSPPAAADREVFSLGPDGMSRRRQATAPERSSPVPGHRPDSPPPAEPVEETIQSDEPAAAAPVDELSRRRQSERQERQRRRAEQAADNASDDRPSRLRRRERSDLKLADLLAEALVAYQSSTAESAGEDILSAYEDLDAPRAGDSERHRGETGY
nr:diguanylate cyclase [Kibdelosporangium phytohabitans]